MNKLKQTGFVHFFPLLVIVAVTGVILFILIASTGSFGNKLFNNLFPKPFSHASLNNQVEAESGSLTAPAVLGSDSNASGGQYVQFGQASTSAFQPTAPYYATFYYMWFQNPATNGSWNGSYWSDGHVDPGSPPNTWFSHYIPDPNPTSFDPATELYSSHDYNNFKWQAAKMGEAKQEVAIGSWWGQGKKEDVAFSKIITDFMGRADNPYPNLRWSIYYENEGFGDPSVVTLVSDLNYIKNTYAASPYYFKINGKPVIFVYGNGADAPGTLLTRWKDANTQTGDSFYVVLKLFGGYTTASPQPDSWHEYSPATRTGHSSHLPYSAFVSPGFWLDNAGQAERLVRNAADFETGVQAMVSSNATWKLTQTWNEWGEGTGVEPAQKVRYNPATGKDELDTSASSSYGVTNSNLYIDILNRNLPALEQGTGGPIAADPVVVAAGDIACGTATVAGSPCQQQATANTTSQIKPTAVLTLGDNQYENGLLVDFQNFYDKSWGAFKSITHPSIGNHEGGEGGSNTGYFDYFNGAGIQSGPAGSRSQGYYSFDLGTWHIIALNGNCGIYSFNGSATGCAAGSAQEVWLKNDLAAHNTQCTLAYWHQSRFSSGHEGNSTNIATYLPFWQALYNAKADIILNGHSHDYERFAPQNPSGVAEPTRGIREFVVGTGGRDFTGFWTNTLTNSQVKNNNTFGVLKLTLHPTSYDFQFVPSVGVNGFANGTFTDSGTGQGCVT